jgi:hypothetical protein
MLAPSRDGSTAELTGLFNLEEEEERGRSDRVDRPVHAGLC